LSTDTKATLILFGMKADISSDYQLENRKCSVIITTIRFEDKRM